MGYRNIQKAIDDFRNLGAGNKGNFVLHDVRAIHDISASEPEAIINALYVGYMVGYKAAKREVREGRC